MNCDKLELVQSIERYRAKPAVVGYVNELLKTGVRVLMSVVVHLSVDCQYCAASAGQS